MIRQNTLFSFKAIYHSYQTKVCVQDNVISAMPTTAIPPTPILQLCLYFLTSFLRSPYELQQVHMNRSYGHRMRGNNSLWHVNKLLTQDFRLYSQGLNSSDMVATE